jgi:tRNA threonylcarbamoyl adenosine modification protein YeaZ
MTILALEFSPPERSAAVAIDGGVHSFVVEREQQSSRVFAMIDEALAGAGVQRAAIECVAVGLGPGSYAGTRMAIAVAQGWQIASGVKLIGINSAAAIALAAQSAGVIGRMNIVFDAQRNEFYSIRYQIGPSEIRVLGDFHLLAEDQEKQRRQAGELFFKADAGSWDAGRSATLFSDARAIAALAEQERTFVAGHQLEPIYLRKAEFIKAPPARFSAGPD